MTTYTVLAYRENGVDTCRNCVMDQSDSAFEFKVFDTSDEAAQFWAEKVYDSLTSARHFCSWDLTLLVNGKEDYDEDIEYVDIKERAKPYIAALQEKERKRKEDIATKEAAKLADKQKADNAAREAAELAIFYKVQKRLEEQSHVK